ncbi:hypothetical protein BC834DRAFT_452182 [Gloeopeniophorella convolvens]|nr:hypothetical protein BC834DRAFT_452182 [Gloeopeniophorella convolvens]
MVRCTLRLRRLLCPATPRSPHIRCGRVHLAQVRPMDVPDACLQTHGNLGFAPDARKLTSSYIPIDNPHRGPSLDVIARSPSRSTNINLDCRPAVTHACQQANPNKHYSMLPSQSVHLVPNVWYDPRHGPDGPDPVICPDARFTNGGKSTAANSRHGAASTTASFLPSVVYQRISFRMSWSSSRRQLSQAQI